MEQDSDFIVCPKCNGIGSFPDVSPFIAPNETPPESKTCDKCNGVGKILRFFVEFEFKNNYRVYWLPLFVLALNEEKANEIVSSTKTALEERFKEVEHSKPIPELKNLTSRYINQKHDAKRFYKLAILDINVWKFAKDIKFDANLSFNKNLEFISFNLPLEERTIAERIQSCKFPVRVIQDSFKLDFKEYLLIDVMAK